MDEASRHGVSERAELSWPSGVHRGMYAPYQRDGLAGALAIHLLLYCGVGACFGFGLYELLQPARVGNPGLAMYKPPPRTVLAYGPTALPPPSQSVHIEAATAAATLPMLEPGTTGQSISEPQVITPPTPLPAKKSERPRTVIRAAPRELKSVQAQARVACLPRYDSSGAQTSGC